MASSAKEWTSAWTNDELNAWLGSVPSEPSYFPETPIIDAHHHLFPEGRKANPDFDEKRFASFGRASTTSAYLRKEIEHDACEVNVAATVHVEARSGYDTKLKFPRVGETMFVRGVYEAPNTRLKGLCKGIVASIDFNQVDEQIQEAIDAHRTALAGSECVLGGVRVQIASHPDYVSAAPPGVVKNFVRGARIVGLNNLVLDVWLYHTQILELCDLAKQCPSTTIVCDHIAMPLGCTEQVFKEWHYGMAQLATAPNVVVKMGGMGMHACGYSSASPLTSDELVDRFTPWFKAVYILFGADRVLFESNFPMDKATSSYKAYWNAAKKMCESFTTSLDDRRKMLFANANRIYRLALSLPDLSLYEFSNKRALI